MTVYLKHFALRTLLGAVLVAGVAACDATSSSDATDQNLDQEIAASVAFVSSDLGLDATETVALKSAFDESSDHGHEVGFLWRVAAELQANLSDAHRERLMNRLNENGAVFGGPGFQFGLEPGFPGHFMDRPGFGPFDRFAMVRGFADELGLTDEQKAAIRQILQGARNELHSLHEAFRAGDIDEETFRANLRSLFDETKAAWEGLLNEDQLAILDQLKVDRDLAIQERQDLLEQERAEGLAVMVDVLGLSDEQVAALEELRQKVQDLRAAFQEMIDAGATREEVKAWAEESRTGISDELVAVLDQTQLEIFLIHGALESRIGMRFREMRHGGPVDGMGRMGPR
jgi:hypothetical protein